MTIHFVYVHAVIFNYCCIFIHSILSL